MSTSLLAIPAAALYVLSGLMIGLAALAAGFAALFLHAVALAYTTFTDQGLNVAFFNILSLVAWTIAALLLVSSVTKPVENLGIVVLPLAGLATLAAWRFPGMQLLPETAPWGLRAHVLVSLLSYALLALASVQAILLAIQDRHLHRRQPGGFVRALPPLQTMEALLFEMIAVGFVLLSVGLASGFIFLEDMFAQHLAHKTILSVAAWTVFALL
ncbi:MAG: cytochrome c biogenesis protein CcsA, partial [Gammaproteobacteria bacterium]|nr:cytochrome c biogenesis protein CcsA [Gammaproteobacteria bacterium]